MSNLSTKRYVVVPYFGDPLYEEGRARLIWAANTADAVEVLGYPALLLDRPVHSWNPFLLVRCLKLQGVPSAFAGFYNVSPELNRGCPKVLPGDCRSFASKGLWAALSKRFLERQLFPHVGCLHTRDWPLAAFAIERGLPVVFEEHGESFHLEVPEYPVEITGRSNFLLAVAISEDARERMLAKGMLREKIEVLPSGVNENAFERFPQEARELKAALCKDGEHNLLLYSGGLYDFRGVDMLLEIARELADCRFIFCGGRKRHAAAYRRKAQDLQLENVTFTGYLSHGDLLKYQQAADALLLPYADENLARITSPLKFYEYLASGLPVVSARMPMLSEFWDRQDLAVEWANIGSAKDFIGAIRKTLKAGESLSAKCGANVALAEGFAWTARQKKLFSRIGNPLEGVFR
ncbi:MAG: glycosyltransferase [Opitutales bacterium]|nr:glycosyltransferase [Opitutales bacterium]